MAALVAGYTAVPRWPWWLAVVATMLFVSTAIAYVGRVYAPGYAADTVDRRLDERQRLVRDRAYRVAYYALTIVFGGLSCW
jgi:hypothetical protein